ncbi:MAG: DNA translocase FtsK [Peptococcaceae bacterium]|nr:DNA translocase FtsK [Peptococcaceae bacterium]
MASRKPKRKVRRKQDKFDVLKNEIIGIIIVGIACLGFVVLYANNGSVVAAFIAKGLKISAGTGSAGIFIILAVLGLCLMAQNKKNIKKRIAGIVLLWLAFEGFAHLSVAYSYDTAELFQIGRAGFGGGIIGAVLSIFLVKLLGVTAGYIVLSVVTVIGAILFFNRSLVQTFSDLSSFIGKLGGILKSHIADFVQVLAANERQKKTKQMNSEKKPRRKKAPGSLPYPAETATDNTCYVYYEDDLDQDNKDKLEADSVFLPNEDYFIDKGVDKSVAEGISQNLEKTEQSSVIKLTGTPLSRKTENTSDYRLPPLHLVHKPMRKGQRTNKDLAEQVKLLEDTLNSFGVKVKVTRVTQGPTITRFEVQPAPGVKVSKITSLADDIALSLAAPDVRMEAPIPGKAAVGIEVPNKEISVVHFREVLESEEFQNSPSKLTFALGKDIAGLPIIGDLTKMPHLLIAGATGSGKSVCINTLIASIVYKAKPDEVKLLLIDPKMVELTTYNGIPHLISPVVTEPQKAAGALKWIVTEMETRYELFAAAGVRDIVRYNFIFADKKDNEQKPLPYVVVIIDELADLMMVAPAEVEEAICRLAQMARAAGIHLIVATQRPSVDVITGLIKANIPSRIAFAVSSQVDSRTILDMGGAEKLLGRGDMLYHPIGVNKPVRVQGCYLADKEVRNIVDYLKEQAKPEYCEIPTVNLETSSNLEPEDELFYKAANVFFENNTASVSLLQRRLRIGYTRAARLMDILEEKGVVGQYEGSKPREILISKGQFESKFGKIDNL